MHPGRLTALLLLAFSVLVSGCTKPAPAAAPAPPPKHEHKPPHGGTPVVLGEEIYHIELVRDAATGTLQAYVFDGELENFIRSAVPALEIDAMVNGQPRKVILSAVANPATGETVGDTALFEGREDWLKATPEFDATLKTITIRGTTFTSVKFNFPKGNDKD
ncbi:MAG: hypothetical protein ACHQ5A_07030 [Opitutales bacterium]